jgi:His-Xaa-Ser system radical SAM maturase HxsB
MTAVAPAVFYPREHYRNATRYSLLPFRFDRRDSGDALLVNEVGEFALVSASDFSDLIAGVLSPTRPMYTELKAKHFLSDDGSSALFDVLAAKYRTKKSFLDGFAKLHIFVTTLRCNQSCPYCQVSRQSTDAASYDMSVETMHRSVDLMLATPSRTVTMEFQGGEPLVNFELLQEGVRYCEERNAAVGKSIDFVVCTNLSILEDRHLEYFKQHRIDVSTSLDGPAYLHDKNRPMGKGGSHAVVTRNILRAQEALGKSAVSCLMTTTKESLKFPREIVDEYLRLGMGSLFVRDLNPFGFAVKTHKATGYTTQEFLQFYKEVLGYIIDINRQGRSFAEAMATMVLTKILTPWPIGFVDLRSPAGAGLGVVLYNYDGSVYASDESRMLAEMGSERFRLGHVLEDNYEELFFGETMQLIASAACNESLVGCSDCAYQPYCGADPVRNFSTQNDLFGHRPTSGFCGKNMGVIKHLLDLLLTKDPELERIFWAWMNREDVNRMHLPEPEWLSQSN